MGIVTQYITTRVNELDELIKKEPEDSKHIYPLTAGKYELLKLATELEIALKGL